MNDYKIWHKNFFKTKIVLNVKMSILNFSTLEVNLLLKIINKLFLSLMFHSKNNIDLENKWHRKNTHHQYSQLFSSRLLCSQSRDIFISLNTSKYFYLLSPKMYFLLHPTIIIQMPSIYFLLPLVNVFV